MARIAGVDLPREKRVEIGLTYIFGIGLADRPSEILAETEHQSRYPRQGPQRKRCEQAS